MWDWFSLDFLYYPVSAVLWFWYKAFGFVFGQGSFFTWMLAVVFFAFTARLALVPVQRSQVRNNAKLQQLQPKIKALQRKYGQDRQRMAVEMQKLQRRNNFHPIMAFLPAVFRPIIFIVFLHVLLSFNRSMNYWFHPARMSPEANRATANYVFSATDVGNFLDAHLFGAPLGGFMVQSSGLDAFSHYSRAAVLTVGLLLLAIATATSYFGVNPQAARLNPFVRYIPPLATLAAGPWLLLGNIVYLLAQNLWTLGEMRYLFDAGAPTKARPETAPRPRARSDELITRAAAVFSSFDSDSEHVETNLVSVLADLRIAFELRNITSREQVQELVNPIRALPDQRCALCAWSVLKSSGAAFRQAGALGEYFASLVAIDGAAAAKRAIGEAQHHGDRASLMLLAQLIDGYWPFWTPGAHRDVEHAQAVYLRGAIKRTLGGDSAVFDKGIIEALSILNLVRFDEEDPKYRAGLMETIASLKGGWQSQLSR